MKIAALRLSQIRIRNWFASDSNLGGTVGMKMVSLTSAQNGRHSHTTLLDEANIMGTIDGNISFQARAVPVKGITTGTSGNGSSHENMQPSLCLNYLIKI